MFKWWHYLFNYVTGSAAAAERSIWDNHSCWSKEAGYNRGQWEQPSDSSVRCSLECVWKRFIGHVDYRSVIVLFWFSHSRVKEEPPRSVILLYNRVLLRTNVTACGFICIPARNYFLFEKLGCLCRRYNLDQSKTYGPILLCVSRNGLHLHSGTLADAFIQSTFVIAVGTARMCIEPSARTDNH